MDYNIMNIAWVGFSTGIILFAALLLNKSLLRTNRKPTARFLVRSALVLIILAIICNAVHLILCCCNG